MVGAFVAAIRIVAKTIVLAVAWTFWFFLGFFVWARVVIVSFVIFMMRSMLSPFSRGAAGAAPAAAFERALRVWPEGFERIWKSVNAPDESDDDPWGTHDAGTFWSTALNFLGQTALAVMFWTPLVLIVHHTGLWRLGFVDDIERAIVRVEPRSPAMAAPIVHVSDPANTATPNTTTAPPNASCLQENSVLLWHPPVRYVVKHHVNTRRGPGTSFAKTGALEQGDIVTVRGRVRGGDWSLIAFGDENRCFVRSTYIEEAPH